MATYTSQPLTASTNGKPIAIGTSSTPVHTATTVANATDEVYLWANNTTAAPIALTIEWGGTADGELIAKALSIPANSGPIQVAPGLRVAGGISVTAKAASAGVNITGFVNHIA